VICRKAQAADLPALGVLDREVMMTPWSEEQIAAELFHPAAHVFVAVVQEQLAGFIVFRKHPPESEILRIAIRPAWQRQGIAGKILQTGLQFLVGQGVYVCFLEVRRSNSAALSFYERVGFTEVGRRPDYYRQPVEEAIVMQLDMKELLEDV